MTYNSYNYNSKYVQCLGCYAICFARILSVLCCSCSCVNNKTILNTRRDIRANKVSQNKYKKSSHIVNLNIHTSILDSSLVKCSMGNHYH